MPTYTVWSEAGLIDDDTRARIASALTEIHHEVAVAPRYFVQVVFSDLTAGAVYIAGRPANRGHVWIRADIRAGRTDEQKQRMLERITAEVAGLVGSTPEDVWVYLCDIPGPSIAEYGRPLPDPGQEDEWFAALPDELQTKLRPLQ